MLSARAPLHPPVCVSLYILYPLSAILSSNLIHFLLIYIHQRRNLMDILFIGITVVLFVASWLFVKLVERV
jgi:hypothetical protein